MHETAQQAEKALDLGNGLSIWKAHPNVLREQDLNARVMSDTKFSALLENVKKDSRLESLPLCSWKTNKAGNQELRIISGHHRIRVARSAMLTEIWVLVFNEELSDNYIKAKQLAHNSINGMDDPQKVKEIYDSIDEIKAKIESAITDAETKLGDAKLRVEDIAMKLDFECLNILFLPHQKEEFENVINLIQAKEGGDIFVSDMPSFDKFKKAARQVAKHENIRNISAILYRMIQISKEYLENEKRKAAALKASAENPTTTEAGSAQDPSD